MPDIKFDDLSRTISSAAENVSRKTEMFLEIQKMKSRLHSAQRAVEKSYRELGELIYRRYDEGEGVDSELAVICEDIIEELTQELAFKKGKKLCPVCQAEIARESIYCMRCGSKVTEEEEEVQKEE